MRTDTPKTIYLKDYKSSPYQIDHIDLNFDIHDGHTIVESRIQFTMEASNTAPLFLHGEDLELLEITLNDAPVIDYETDSTGLTLPCPGLEKFTLFIKTKIVPEKNTRLEGLYKSGDTYCTQCEAEGFRRITYYLDRPDIMTTFTVRIEADEKYPVLLSNGNRVDGDQLENGRHYTIWEDPWPKPCYLFALVAGDLTHIHDTFTTKSGREVDLFIFVRPGDEGQCDHAMESLKKSMRWDEEVYGLEYDLDLFNIVAVSDFNMGAMENKSLNIFNTALVLAHQDTATDTDFMRVESVIAHEYFHNWSGNRVTCRDWFQLSLKEGLTVFRDQEFSAYLHSRDVQRIDDVTHLRRLQFPEDAGPLAHPIRPDNYIEINNFYTMTVYEKGAEVIRMTREILGKENYRKATDLYFSRHDGQAVTCDDWVQCMEDASGIDLSQFKLWYSQAGTPEVTFKGEYDESAQTFTAHLTQKTPDTPGQSGKKPMMMPIKLALYDENGTEYPLSCHPDRAERAEGSEANTSDPLTTLRFAQDEKEVTIMLTQEKQSFAFENIPKKPVPSVLRGFSAPVKLTTDLTDDDLAFLMVNDSDGFNRWEAGQTYMLRVLQEMIDKGSSVPEKFMQVYSNLVESAMDESADKALMARALSIPDIGRIAQNQKVIDTDKVHQARETVLNTIVDQLGDHLAHLYARNRSGMDFSITAEAMGRRVLQNTVFLLMSNKLTQADAARAIEHYTDANNMTDRMAALHLGCALDGAAHDQIVGDFYNRFKNYPLVVDKWFAAQASIHLPKTMSVVNELRKHPDFNIKNPNRARSLYAAFAMNNPVRFHAVDGSGYNFLRDAIIELNTINPQIGARLLTPFREWRRHTSDRQDLMKAALEEILKTPNLAPDIYEIASKSLKD